MIRALLGKTAPVDARRLFGIVSPATDFSFDFQDLLLKRPR
jgi:hypothetical protein